MKQAVAAAEKAVETLHRIPERSFREFETTRCVRDFCARCGVPLIDLGMETGAAAYLDCGKGASVALRADLDAVTTEEGPRHLCGHDYHTASLLGAMRYLSEHRGELPRNVVFLFQPAEENTSGAAAMLAHGLLEKLPQKPERLFGIHNRPEIPRGQIAVHAGPLMAEKSEFSIRLAGRAGHGGTPHLCVDPLVAAADLTMALQTVVSRNVDPFDPAVCAVCSIMGGSTVNLAPESVTLTGAVRTLRHDAHLRIRERLETLAEEIARGYECALELAWPLHIPGVVNGPEMTRAARSAAEKTVGAENVTDTAPCLGSEDFAVFGEAMPAFFYWVGSGVPGERSAAWHSPDFRVAEGYLSVAVPLLVRSALEP